MTDKKMEIVMYNNAFVIVVARTGHELLSINFKSQYSNSQIFQPGLFWGTGSIWFSWLWI